MLATYRRAERSFMSWLLWAVLSAICTALERAANRFSLANRSRYVDYMLAYNIGAILFVTFAGSLEGFQLPNNATQVGWLAVSGLLWFFGCVYSFKADQSAEVSLTALVSQMKLLFMFVAGVWIFNETISFSKFLGVILVLIGLIVRLQVRGSFNRGTVFKTLAVIITSGATLIDKSLSQSVSAGTLAIGGYLLPLVFTVIMARKHLSSFVDYCQKEKLRPLLIGVLSGIAHFALIKAFTGGPLSVVIPIYYLHIVFVFMIGILFLNERQHLKRKVLAALFVVAGAIIIRLSVT